MSFSRSTDESRINVLYTTRVQLIKRFINATFCCTFLYLLFISEVQADNLELPTDVGASKHNLLIKTPNRGMRMEQVNQEFGEPSKILTAVGDPPITRWIYPKFTVHFENEFVILAVINK